ncbi:DUF6390 family protein [Mycobacterium sp. CVI_P3]|uniref:DUF6390 family protein n=1 Tax=Mycobacterium pinniadriaticum TaxID=2994102 RepID=A0ABT3SCB5_9MYCO|nr:DUF6390 family protein [Mycobacterium pinniadriaticum]MCX2929819.1 DUF6390 family protein [Mycobacterium pinniadriaticum]MCX2936532.1 DUF6390 family protein [Mycobacterium pinniadriaticum]
MTSQVRSKETGWELFARFAFPSNELGYCGPPDASVLLSGHGRNEVAGHARGFDGAWPYLEEIAAAAGTDDPLDAEVVRTYWVGGPLLSDVDAGTLRTRLRQAFARQPTGLLDELDGHGLAHHSFHVFVVYPWVRFLDADPTTPLRILQDCRIRWGVVDSVGDEQIVMVSRALTFDGGMLRLGEQAPETVRWRRDGVTLAPPPAPGDTVAAHWDWVCGRLDADETAALAAATSSTLDLVNAARR